MQTKTEKNNMLKLRTDHAISQSEMAKLLNVSKGTVAKWDQQQRNPSIPICFRIIKIFNIHMEDIFVEEE